MTREEAIEILKQFKKCLSDVVFDEKGSEAWQMAIKALSQEPCDDAISREDAIKALQKVACYSAAIRARMIGTIEDLPPVTHKSGKWIEKDGWDGDVYYECSVCGEPFCLIDGTPTDNMYNYCPNCGARMRGAENG